MLACCLMMITTLLLVASAEMWAVFASCKLRPPKDGHQSQSISPETDPMITVPLPLEVFSNYNQQSCSSDSS